MAVSYEQLAQLYLAYFGRVPDLAGVAYYTTDPTESVHSVAAKFSASSESQALHGPTFGAAQIDAIYQLLFNRSAEAGGLDYWAGEVASGRLSPAMAAYGILIGAQNADASAVANKLAIGNAFYEAMDLPSEVAGYEGAAAASHVRDFLRTVTSDGDSRLLAQAKLDQQVAVLVRPPDGEPKTNHSLQGGERLTLWRGVSSSDDLAEVRVLGATAASEFGPNTGITVQGLTGTLETLDIISEGSAPHSFSLASVGGIVLGQVRILGTAGANLYLTHEQVHGLALDATGSTGPVRLVIDRNGAETQVTDLSGLRGVEEVVYWSSSYQSHSAGVATSAFPAGVPWKVSTVLRVSSMEPVPFSVAGAATRSDDTLEMTLDHNFEREATQLHQEIRIDDVETLVIRSMGRPDGQYGGITNALPGLVGDFRQVTVLGDSTLRLNLELDPLPHGTPTVALDASGLTGAAGLVLNFNAPPGENSTTRYQLTGSRNQDWVRTGIGDDVVLLGDGDDYFNWSGGYDELTLGAGVDHVSLGYWTAERSRPEGYVSISDFTIGNHTRTWGDASQPIPPRTADSIGLGQPIPTNVHPEFRKGTLVDIVGQANSILVVTDRTFASIDEALAAVRAGNRTVDYYGLVFLNSTSGVTEIWADEPSATSAGTKLAEIRNIVTLAGVAELHQGNIG